MPRIKYKEAIGLKTKKGKPAIGKRPEKAELKKLYVKESRYIHYICFGDYDGYNPKSQIKKDSYFKNILDLNSVLVYGENISDIETKLKYKLKILKEFKKRWEEYCQRWDLQIEWDGKFHNLHNFIIINKNEKIIINFGRDLVWYKLRTESRLGPMIITRLWKTYKNIPVDDFYVHQNVKKVIKRFRQRINSL